MLPLKIKPLRPLPSRLETSTHSFSLCCSRGSSGAAAGATATGAVADAATSPCPIACSSLVCSLFGADLSKFNLNQCMHSSALKRTHTTAAQAPPHTGRHCCSSVTAGHSIVAAPALMCLHMSNGDIDLVFPCSIPSKIPQQGQTDTSVHTRTIATNNLRQSC